jgi:putative restriction endonuclease
MLSKYLHQFTKLHRSMSNGGAPHKPVLLLSILELVGKGEIGNNRIAITPELVLTFKNSWSKVVVTQHTANFALPFYHMKSEPFWRLVTNAGMIIPVTSSNSIKSLSSLKESVAFAEIDKELFEVLQDPVQRTVLEEALLETYFPETKANYYSSNYNLFDAIEQQIVSEDATVYRERIESLKESLQKEAFEEEMFVRGGVFKREIPKIYNYQCAISGMRIESLSNAQMVDACHIVPFAISKDDTISNGVSLSPNLHRAYDRGLITITEDYIVRISPTITEVDSPFSLKQFEGKQISLPQQAHHFPSPQNLAWHRKETFRM